MSQYGQIIDSGYDPTKNSTYKAFVDYFNNPIMTKIKNVRQYSVYMVKIHSMLGTAYRYLIVFVPLDGKHNGFTQSLKDCDWISLQTRTLEDRHDIPSIMHSAKPEHPLKQKIHMTSQNTEQTEYSVDNFPLNITLLHTRKNHTFQYSPTGTIVSALETYQTIITFIK